MLLFYDSLCPLARYKWFKELWDAVLLPELDAIVLTSQSMCFPLVSLILFLFGTCTAYWSGLLSSTSVQLLSSLWLALKRYGRAQSLLTPPSGESIAAGVQPGGRACAWCVLGPELGPQHWKGQEEERGGTKSEIICLCRQIPLGNLTSFGCHLFYKEFDFCYQT